MSFEFGISVTRYATRHWAVWLSKELIAVTVVYRKGAMRVAEPLQSLLAKSDAR